MPTADDFSGSGITDMRPSCPRCGRFLAWKDCGEILDVLTVLGVDLVRDVANCGKCGLIEYVIRPARASGWAASDG
jgi:ribosomal protein S27AE